MSGKDEMKEQHIKDGVIDFMAGSFGNIYFVIRALVL